ncbi:metal-dependent transcriptional regulator [Corynebacterium sp. NML130628]|uniref:metal-dependent transcriptional regulator n=1 Tax=Corynebacterium sp. NML130628 TaxID=1906333 RepID=UPI0008FB76A7|nr:metal-dependent transcriptional regulator [Corynebacterium sp. NML130628]OIR45517.1 metal-dependent regulator [Corynebacterium sp. NML130628]
MRDLVDTTEMYLRTVYELEEEGIVPLRARIAERLEQSGPTVSQTVARMERDGLIIVEADRSLSLTNEGRARATAVMRKHRLAECLLTDILKLGIEQVHDEACRWEHVMSEAVEKRVYEVLDHPQVSPFGNPIPALDEIGAPKAAKPELGTRATDLDLSQEREAVVVQISEILQLEAERVPELTGLGNIVGKKAELTALEDGGLQLLLADERSFIIPDDLAHAVRVELG